MIQPEDKGRAKSLRAIKEEEILTFWKKNNIFEETLKKDSPEGEFVFFEGPPTANAKPAFHHIAARVFKDALPRYKTMRGFHVPRRAGWDTHGLPVELQIEKKLGLTSKKDIEKYGIALFNKECRESVFEYIGEWEKFTKRIGYWTDFENAYYTFNNSYIESVWSILKHVNERNLLYKDYKVVPWCPRCGTALSSHELAQGYKDVKDLSVYAKFKLVDFPKAYFLAWTTTPWTLPGNLALAVGKDIPYVEAKVGEEIYVLAKERLSILNEPYEIIAEHLGSEMVGMSYEPLYPFLKENLPEEEVHKLDKAFKIYAADFVNTTDGTGIVHTAVMYGQDDFELGTKIGLPKAHLVDEAGHFTHVNGFLAGKFVKEEETSIEIIKNLAHSGHLYKKEKYEHSYPHCWRCKTPLIYYARDSWYIRMSELRDELVSENEKINWEPAHIKEGRFGDWLREVKDWAISRERYWGTPLPVWESPTGKKMVIGSIDEMKERVKKSGNEYFVMRHGGTGGNAHERVSFKDEANDHLTDEGKTQAEDAIEELRNKKIDLIISSPFARTRETSEIVREKLGLSEDSVVFDERLIEVNPGEFDGKNWNEYHEYMYTVGPDWYTRQIPGGESLNEVGRRIGSCLYDLENTYKDKNILIVTHGGPAWLCYVVAGTFKPDNKEYKKAGEHVFVPEFKRFKNAEIRKLDFIPLPHNENYELDLHKPYIDSIELEHEGESYVRTKEVMDVWFDSGSVPFSQDPKHITFPGDFISEAIDQTRGWFYTLHAIGVLMGRGHAFKNAICLGHILDKDGKKMSKSIGNILDPWELMDKYGVDTLRLWMYSVNQPGESKNFDERSVDEIQKRVFNLLDNVYTFYDLYRDKNLERKEFKLENVNPLDAWILVRLSALTEEMTESMDEYKLLEPVRGLRDFIDDLSTWYVRRSRDRIKNGDENAKQVLYFVLKNISKLLAPFAPFAAEDLYQKLRREDEPVSVHLSSWPEAPSSDVLNSVKKEEIVKDMQEVRRLVTLALEARSKANIKIRQPLSKLVIKQELKPPLLEIIKEELNVKEIQIDSNQTEEVTLDTELTAELIEEGKVRELIRSIQDERKEAGLTPVDVMVYTIKEGEEELFKKYEKEISKATNITLSA